MRWPNPEPVEAESEWRARVRWSRSPGDSPRHPALKGMTSQNMGKWAIQHSRTNTPSSVFTAIVEMLVAHFASRHTSPFLLI